MASDCELPKRVKGYIKYLHSFYQKQNNENLCRVLKSCLVRVQEEWSYDNWNGGTYGHAVFLYLPESVLLDLDMLDIRLETAHKIRDSLNKCSDSIPNEGIDEVFFELLDTSNPKCKAAINPFDKRIVQDDVSQIWKPGLFRLFISHRDGIKSKATELSIELERFGISCFVAHDNIIPMSEWQNEIEKALFTMNACLLFQTDDFYESVWTSQEVGAAMGMNVPMIVLKLGQKDPMGFVSKYQALKGSMDSIRDCAKPVFEYLLKIIPRSSEIEDALVNRFVNSNNFDEAIFAVKNLLPTVSKFNQKHIDMIVDAMNRNRQLNGCYVVNKELPSLMLQKTGIKFEKMGGAFGKANEFSEEIPF